MRVAGADGCRNGWAVVALDDGRFADARIVASLAELHDDPAAVVAVDTPMGELTGAPRRAESEARAFLPGKASTIFTPPPLEALACDTYEAACAVAQRRSGKKISRQAWGLRRVMLDARDSWRANPARFREVHPECSFRQMAGGVVHSKKATTDGQAERRALLVSVGINLPFERFARGVAGDLVDAAAIAWTADRVARGEAFSLPSPPEVDADGREVAIWV